MTEEEKKKIQIINNFIMYCRGFEEKKYTDKELFTAIEDISILIQNQQAELEKKDKMINLMAKTIVKLRPCHFKKEKGGELLGEYRLQNKEEWKQYFEKQVEIPEEK